MLFCLRLNDGQVAAVAFLRAEVYIAPAEGEDISDPQGGVQSENDEGIISRVVIDFFVVIPECCELLLVFDGYSCAHNITFFLFTLFSSFTFACGKKMQPFIIKSCI